MYIIKSKYESKPELERSGPWSSFILGIWGLSCPSGSPEQDKLGLENTPFNVQARTPFPPTTTSISLRAPNSLLAPTPYRRAHVACKTAHFLGKDASLLSGELWSPFSKPAHGNQKEVAQVRGRDFLTSQDWHSLAPSPPSLSYKWAEALLGSLLANTSTWWEQRENQRPAESGRNPRVPASQSTTCRLVAPLRGQRDPGWVRRARALCPFVWLLSITPFPLTVLQEQWNFDPFYLLFYSQCRGPYLTHCRRPINICKSINC